MTPTENFDHQLFLASTVWLAHAMRCLDKGGALDDEARQSLKAHLAYLGETVAELAHLSPDEESEAAAAHFDVLVRILPPPLRDGS